MNDSDREIVELIDGFTAKVLAMRAEVHSLRVEAAANGAPMPPDPFDDDECEWPADF
jgi:hypothetical protein